MAPAVNSIASSLEVWGGIECTMNRVGDAYSDQLALSGHDNRPEDLRLFADLGIQAIRYPVLWERTAPSSTSPIDWRWADQRLGMLRSLEVSPIVGLLHHGSGPLHTSLIANDFASGLAQFAEQVARRYPWVEFYTPVNEPLTTARFSALYGHWYPHERSDHAFARALINQCRGTIEAMGRIRSINPGAKLIQTENLEQIHSTPKLRYQASFENERRWLSFDLLLGRVTTRHPLRMYLEGAGISARELDWFQANAIEPDIAGWNYYLTSERFLDQRMRRYPVCSHGGNGRDRYADVEAVRVCGDGLVGLRELLREAWQRFGLPMAITEAHLGCRRESQLRWFLDAWRAAESLRSDGVDVRAVTAWSLLGAFDWNSLCTRADGFYESGVFDLRGGKPRPTALAKLIRGIAQGTPHEHPALPEHGWWNCEDRLLYPAVHTRRKRSTMQVACERNPSPILITGASGTLGRAFAWACRQRRLEHVLLSRTEMDITNVDSIEAIVRHYRPWAIVNTAGYVRVDEAEQDEENCRLANTTGPLNLAHVCAREGVSIVTFSSDLVFDGQRRSPYLESDRVGPLSVYGVSKADAERAVLEAFPQALVVRTSAFFGPWDDHNFLTITLRRIAHGMAVAAAEDWIVSPTYVPDLVNAVLDLCIDDEQGLWHLANSGSASWADFARMGALEAGLDHSQIRGCPGADLGLIAPRPTFSVLGSERGLMLPTLQDSIRRYWREAQHARPVLGPGSCI